MVNPAHARSVFLLKQARDVFFEFTHRDVAGQRCFAGKDANSDSRSTESIAVKVADIHSCARAPQTASVRACRATVHQVIEACADLLLSSGKSRLAESDGSREHISSHE
jgi:hypothetical protein